ncbi:MAG: Asd/ArgC dimerization domain-containing protein [Succinivibrio sp.]
MLKLAVYGYDTDIGKLLLETLEETDSFIEELYPLTPFKGEYDAVKLKDHNYFVTAVDEFDFSKADCAVFLTTQDESARLVAKARDAGCTVIDNSHLFSGDGKTAVVVPELNPYEVKKSAESKLLVPALAPAVQLCLALSVLHDEFGISKASVTSLESVSEHGRLGTETLAHESTLLLNGMDSEHPGFPCQLAFNLLTSIGTVEENGYSDHESAISSEVERILGRFERGFDITCIQVPVFYGHTMVVNVDLEEAVTREKVREAFEKSSYTTVREDDEVLSPVEDIINERTVLISRIRQHKAGSKSVSIIMMMDNTRRGEAITIVGILKLLDK